MWGEFNPGAWNWAQWVYLGITVLSMGGAAYKHGEPIKGTVHAGYRLAGLLIGVWILLVGGFFRGGA